MRENTAEMRSDEMKIGFTWKMEHWIIALETKRLPMRILPNAQNCRDVCINCRVAEGSMWKNSFL